jgi:hypothetical protein
MTHEEFEAELSPLTEVANPLDAAIVAELMALADGLEALFEDRSRRLFALGRLVPQSSDERDALARAGLAWADTGLPQSFSFRGPWLPADLNDAKRLLAWLIAHPPSLPRAAPAEL